MLKNISNPSKILELVKKNGFVIFENAIEKKTLKEMENFWINYFDKKNIKKIKNQDVFGATRSIGDYNYDSFRNSSKFVIYRRTEFPWNKSIHKLTQNLSYEMNKMRNLTMGLNENHGLMFDPSKEILFNQVNCYPPNTGLMFPHKDTKNDKLLLSCMFNITSKNIHYQEGGLYLSIDDKKIDIDSLMPPCSTIFYNGNLTHGVDKIISNKGIGRIAGYPMKQFFLSKSKLPNYIKGLIRLDNAIKKRIGFKSAPKQGNSALIEN